MQLITDYMLIKSTHVVAINLNKVRYLVVEQKENNH